MEENFLDTIRHRLKNPVVAGGLVMAVVVLIALIFPSEIKLLLGLSSDERIGIATGKPLPKYTGRDIREIRMVPEEVKLFTEDQKEKIRQRILDAAGSIDVNPDVLDPWLQLGLYKKVIGDFEGARDAWEYASLIRPQNVVSFKNLGELYWRYMPDFLKAETNLRIAIANEPKLIDSYITLSEVYRYSYKEKADSADDILLEGLPIIPKAATSSPTSPTITKKPAIKKTRLSIFASSAK